MHLPYLSQSSSSLESQAEDVAAHCNSVYMHVSQSKTTNLAFDLSKKYVIYLDFPSMNDVDSGVYILHAPCGF